MNLQDDIKNSIILSGAEEAGETLFEGMSLPEKNKADMLASLMAGHHILLTGQPGVGKTMLSTRIIRLLQDREVVHGCPVNCLIDSPECPWCLQRLQKGEKLTSKTLKGENRLVKVSGSGDLAVADLVGDLDPQMAIDYGIFDLRAFVPGKLLRANKCILILDFMDRMPERVLNTILSGLAGDTLSIGKFDETFPLDIMIIATGAEGTLNRLPIDLADHFDSISLSNSAEPEFEEKLFSGSTVTPPWKEEGMKVVQKTRNHEDLSRGLSIRGSIRYGELISSYSNVIGENAPEKVLPEASRITLPHRVKVAPHAESNRHADEIIDEIVQESLGLTGTKEQMFSLSKENMLAIVEEIARKDHFRKPLKFGLFDILLKRIKRFPESELANVHQEMYDRLALKYKNRDMDDNLTLELLSDIDEVQERQARLSAELRAKLEEEALIRTLDMLEESQILTRGGRGYNLSRRGIMLLLERLAPRLWEGSNITGQGKHKTGKKHLVGEGRIVGTRSWRFGDRYRDVSLNSTIRQAIRNRHQKITRDDIRILKRDIRTRMDIILCLDLSGTMDQLEKLWYGKESAIALALASSSYGDRVGLVTFSNMAKVVSDLTTNTYRLTERVLDLELKENAFTNIGYGLLTARGLFSRHSKSHSKQHIILVSDGDATAPHPSPGRFAIKEAAKTIRKGITISCICIDEENSDVDLMNKIARLGRGRTTLIEDSKSMKGALVEEMYGAAQ
ncbi:MAG: VWA domain-containing protein [Desulfobacteraceae bacterium]|jgi:Mg-chelatase subunit ChlD/MoxR-like ATPase|nr:VWA domain-containing protein [Desulfobacteraceae bacterium]